MRVLLIKLTSMGDLFHTLPALTELQEYRPGLTIDWLVDEQFTLTASTFLVVHGCECFWVLHLAAPARSAAEGR